MTGAGVSVWAGYRTWKQVIDRLAAVVTDRRGAEVDAQLIVRNHTSAILRPGSWPRTVTRAIRGIHPTGIWSEWAAATRASFPSHSDAVQACSHAELRTVDRGSARNRWAEVQSAQLL